MEKKENKQFKALYFDLQVSKLRLFFSATSPTGAYKEIKKYLLAHNFSHEQYSGYHSNYRTTDLRIFDLIEDMGNDFPWLSKSLNHFEVTDVGANYDLMGLFAGDDFTMEEAVLKSSQA